MYISHRFIAVSFAAALSGSANASNQLILPTLVTHSQSKNQPARTTHNGNLAIHYNGASISNQGSHSASDFLKHHAIASVQATGSNPNDQALSIHGFGANAAQNSLLMIDGIPMTTLSMNGPYLNMVLVNNIKSINIIPGSQGVRYGAQAIGGVVSITTITPIKNTLSIESGLGNLGQAQWQTFISHRIDTHNSFAIGANITHAHNSLENNKVNNQVVNAKFNHMGNRDSYTINLLNYNNRLQLPASYIWQQPTQQTSSNKSTADQGQIIYGINTFAINPNWSWQTHAMWLHSKEATTVLNSNLTQYGVYLDNTLTKNHYLLAGISLNAKRYRLQNQLLQERAREFVGAIYSRINRPLNKAWHIIIGARYSHQWLSATKTTTQSISSPVWVSEIGLTYQPKQHWHWYLRRAGNYRFANGKERLWSSNNFNTLKTQTGVAYETGVTWHQGRSNIGSDIYMLNINNELAYTPDPQPFGNLVNLPPTRRLGIDLHATTQLSPMWAISFGANAVNPKIRSGIYSGKTIPGVSPVNASITISLTQTQLGIVSLNENYHSNFYASDDFSNSQAQLPPVWLTNVNWHKQFKHISANIAVNNIFNNHRPRYAIYQDFAHSIFYYPSNGLSILLSLSINLGKLHG